MADLGTKEYKVQLLTPDKEFFVGEAVFTSIPAVDGELGVLANHAPMVARLSPGAMRMHSKDGKRFYFITGGFAEMNANVLTVLATGVDCIEGCTVPEADSQYHDACCLPDTTPKEAELKKYSIAKARAMQIIARDLAGL